MGRMNRRQWLGKMSSALVAGQAIPLVAGKEKRRPASAIQVATDPAGVLTLRNSVAEFEVLPSGGVRAFLRKDGRRVTLDEPQDTKPPQDVELRVSGKEIRESDFGPATSRVLDVTGIFGPQGKRVEAVSRTNEAPVLKRILTLEVYHEFPAVAVLTSRYRNLDSLVLELQRLATTRRRLSASLSEPEAAPQTMYSFHGSSGEWGKDDVVQLSPDFSRENAMGAATRRGQGGGVPVVAFWTALIGEAVGHIELLPFECSFPVRVDSDNGVRTSMQMNPGVTLKPGEWFAAPRTFIAVFSGDFFKPLSLYSRMLQKEGWILPQPSPEAYKASWCGWGYEFDVTPKDMLGTKPRLREFGIEWATLDDRWFDSYGDWIPRQETFPGDALKKMVEDYHRDGMKVQIWWRALAAEDGQGRYEGFQHKLSKVVAEHPEWLILNKDGSHARLSRSLAVLCPALPEVQEYHRSVARRFVRDWDIDGHKLDNAFSVPPCFNAAHHHRSPADSVAAVGEVYRAIFETTRKLKPRSVTQICSCGTPPNYAWLPYLDQAVTADPVGSRQVRLRIKMLKALLGPQAAVYGDHVELTEIKFRGDEELDLGWDFASTIGAGGVVGTKFVWPDTGKFKEALLTPEKEVHWKKWIGIYNSLMLSRGRFLDLYSYGYDVPEAYAISKEGKMYYAFFAPKSGEKWNGTIELRGLAAGSHRVTDYVNKRDFGVVHGPSARIDVQIEGHLLIEAVGA